MCMCQTAPIWWSIVHIKLMDNAVTSMGKLRFIPCSAAWYFASNPSSALPLWLVWQVKMHSAKFKATVKELTNIKHILLKVKWTLASSDGSRGPITGCPTRKQCRIHMEEESSICSEKWEVQKYKKILSISHVRFLGRQLRWSKQCNVVFKLTEVHKIWINRLQWQGQSD